MAPDGRKIAGEQVARLLETGVQSTRDLLDLVRDEEGPSAERHTACWLLARIGDRRSAAPVLAYALVTSKDSSLRESAADALGVLGGVRARRALRRALSEDPSHGVRVMAAYALGPVEVDPALLLEIVGNHDEHPELRAEAVDALRWVWSERVAQVVRDALRDEAPEVRLAACYALGNQDGPEAIPLLEEVAATDKGVVKGLGSIRRMAKDAIKQIREHPLDD